MIDSSNWESEVISLGDMSVVVRVVPANVVTSAYKRIQKTFIKQVAQQKKIRGRAQGTARRIFVNI